MKHTIEVDCFADFDDDGKIKICTYIGEGSLAPVVFTFDLNEIIRDTLEYFSVPTDIPYIRKDDEDARNMYENIVATLSDGIECAERKYNDLIEAGA
jgi:hypothetical protein